MLENVQGYALMEQCAFTQGLLCRVKRNERELRRLRRKKRWLRKHSGVSETCRLATLLIDTCIYILRRRWTAPTPVLADLVLRDRQAHRIRHKAADLAICTICQNVTAQRHRCLELACGHTFHLDCIDRWLHVRLTCPTCRSDVVEAHFEERIAMIRMLSE